MDYQYFLMMAILVLMLGDKNKEYAWHTIIVVIIYVIFAVYYIAKG